MTIARTPFATVLVLLMALVSQSVAHASEKLHGVTVFGAPALPADFQHLPYVEPDAPKGGSVVLSANGTFDSLNPFVLKGTPAAGLGLVSSTLLTTVDSEPTAEYGLIAEFIEVADDKASATYYLNPKARWHDGQPITADDVVWSFDTLIKDGAPQFRAYYADVTGATALDAGTVRFTFKDGLNPELPMILGQLPVLPKHWWSTREFGPTTLEIPLTSGPYKVKAFESGRFIEYERVSDWWAADLPIFRGRYNFDIIRYEYYRDFTVEREAFKAGRFDFNLEASSRNWATGYDFPAVKEGWVKREVIPDRRTRGMQGYVMNLRRPLFQNPKVREAMTYVWDFEWVNKTLSDGNLIRSESYFAGGDLASSGLPSAEELEVLEPLRGQIPDEVFTKPYKTPTTDGSGNNRANLRTALMLLQEAGWTVGDDRKLRNAAGEPFQFELLLRDPAFERIALPMQQSLDRLGIDMTMRTVDTSQYINRLQTFDFDMTIAVFGQSDSPGNEQREYWGSANADKPGSRNLIGIKSAAIDTLVDLIVTAPTRADLVTRTHALDRVLLWGHYVIPHFHTGVHRLAYWDKFGKPDNPPEYGIGFPSTWWIDPEREAALAAARGRN